MQSSQQTESVNNEKPFHIILTFSLYLEITVVFDFLNFEG
jgi:hypothetical protein